MANELECSEQELEKGLKGEKSWQSQYFQNLYNKTVKGIDVYEIKPWEITIGDKLKLRDKDTLRKLEKEDCIPAHWFEELHDYIENSVKEIVVDEDIYNSILSNNSVIASLLFNKKERLYWHISLPMLQFAERKEKVEIKKEKDEPPTYSIKCLRKDEAIIEEMIKKVNKKRLKTLLSISASLGESMRHIVSNEVVDKYLRLWAESKYEFYLLMGRELTISQDVELEMNVDEIKLQKKELMTKFPKYALYIDDIPWQYYKDNEMGCNTLGGVFQFGRSFFTGKGMKLSKFFSQFFQDADFDIEFSKILQDKKINSTIFISIDPYDYLTSAINQHGWKSCHRITDGEYGTGSVSYMLDETTLVAYRAKKDVTFQYDYWGLKFKGNSKQFRQLIYFDKSSCGIIFGRQYPNGNKEVAKHIRHLLEDRVANSLNIDNNWKVYNEAYDGDFKDIAKLHYSDVSNGFAYKFARISNSKMGVSLWEVGSELPCLCGCDTNVVKRGERAICDKCIEELGDSDNYFSMHEDDFDDEWD